MNNRVQQLLDAYHSETDHLKKAQYLHELRYECQMRIADIARAIKKTPSYVSHSLRLVRLPDIVRDGYYNQQLSFAHLVILSRLPSEEAVTAAYEQILLKSLTSADTELLVRSIKYQIDSTTERLDPKTLLQWSKDIEKKYKGVTCSVKQSRIRGAIDLRIDGDTHKTSAILHALQNALINFDADMHNEEVRDLMILE